MEEEEGFGIYKGPKRHSDFFSRKPQEQQNLYRSLNIYSKYVHYYYYYSV